MDRLSALIAAAVIVGAACGDSAPSGRSRERVNAVQARPADQPQPAAMCDVYHGGADAPNYTGPVLASRDAPVPAGYWRWVNVWATWCKPCIEELPRLRAWRQRLDADGARVSLQLVSADATAVAVAEFRSAHPGTPASARLADPDALPAWLATMGVAGATLPVHVFVDPGGRVRCIRASAVDDSDFPAVAALLAAFGRIPKAAN